MSTTSLERRTPVTGDRRRTRHDLAVLIPAYNEEDAIEHTIDRLQSCLAESGRSFEIIVIDDGSRDGTPRLLGRRSDIKLLEHPVNQGYGASLKTGVRHARSELIAIVDADGTYPLERLPDLVRLAERADMVVGARTGENVRYSKIRSLPKWFLGRFARWMARRPIPDMNSGMRVMRRSVVERFLHILPDGFSFTTTITLAMLSSSYIVHFEPIDYHRRVGKSKIRPFRDTLNFVQLILRTGMYFAPLRVFLPVAGVFFAAFAATLGYDLWQGDLTERTLLLLVAATQLTMFALLADMIHRRDR